MHKRRWPLVLGVAGLLLVAAAAAIFATRAHERWLRRVIESTLNQRAAALFNGSVRIGRVRLDESWRLRLEEVRAVLPTSRGDVPIAIGTVQTVEPVAAWLRTDPITLVLDDLRLGDAGRPAARAVAQLTRQPAWRLELQAQLLGLGLDQLEWLNPTYLDGATGELMGDVLLRVSEQGDVFLACDLHVPEPGGLIQARIFELLTPYLPTSAQLQPLIQTGGVVAYQQSRLHVELPATDRMVVRLHLLVPAYNVDVQLTMDIRVDERDIVRQLVRLIGVFRPGP